MMLYKKMSFTLLFVLMALSINSIFAGSNMEMEKAIELFESQKYSDAKKIFISIVDKESDNPEACYYLGRISLINKNIDSATDYFKKAVKLNEKNSKYYHWLGISYSRSMNNVSKLKLPFIAMKMKGSLEKAVELDPDNIEARHDLMGYYLNAPSIGGGGVEKAEGQAAEISKRDPETGKEAFFDIYINRAWVSINEKKYEDAYQKLIKIIEDYPDKTLPYYSIAYIGVNSDHYLAEAEKNMQICLKMVTDLKPETENEKRMKSRLHALHFMMGTLYEKNGKKDLAKKEYEIALKIKPDYNEAKEALSRL